MASRQLTSTRPIRGPNPLLRHKSEQVLSPRTRGVSKTDIHASRLQSDPQPNVRHQPKTSISPEIPDPELLASPETLQQEVFMMDGIETFHTGDVINNVTNLYSTSLTSEEDCTVSGDLQKLTMQKFSSSAERWVREISGESMSPIDLDMPLTKVDLELTSEQGLFFPIDAKFGRNRRSTGKYLPPRGTVSLTDIFKLSEGNARAEANRRCTSGPSKEKYITQHGNRVLVTGQAGIGKTTISKKIAQIILNKKILSTTEIVFYIRVRDINFKETLSLVDFLLKYGVSDGEEFTSKEKLLIWKSIKKNPNIVLILDGLDEANAIDIPSGAIPKVGSSENVLTSLLVGNILKGTLLSQVKVVVTCRPRQAFCLSPQYRPGAVIRIIGLSTDAQKNIGKQICGLRDATRVYQALHEDPDLESACYVPVFCIILYAALHHDNDPMKPKLNTITSVMLFLLRIYLRSEHMREIDLREFINVVHLARVGFAKKQSVFNQSDIDSARISPLAFQAFMVTYLDPTTKLKFRILEGDQQSCFSHMIWQEFFTALDLLFFAETRDFEEHQSLLLGDLRWEVVGKFMYGLTNIDNMNQFKQNINAWRPCQIKWNERSGLLKTYAECWFQRTSYDSYNFLHVCNVIREARDQSFTLKAANRLPQTLKVSGSDGEPIIMFNNDVRSIWGLLNVAAEFNEQNPVKTLDFDQVEFSGDSFVRLANSLAQLTKKIENIRLVECTFGDAGTASLAKLLHKFDRIHIAYCEICSDALYSHYSKMPDPRPEVWTFETEKVPRDFGYDLRNAERRRKSTSEDQTFEKTF